MNDHQARSLLAKVYSGSYLTATETQEFIVALLKETVSQPLSAALLTLLSQRGESQEEIRGALQAMRSFMKRIDLKTLLAADKKIIDVVGTGGDGKCGVNISSATAISLAAMGLPCAKHGNSAQSGLVGSADIFKSCALPINLDIEEAKQFFKKHHFLFLFAPLYHPQLGKAKPLRQMLKIPTIFNVLGPLANPSDPDTLLIGASSLERVKRMLHASYKLKSGKVCCYTSEDGFDEVSTAAPTHFFFQDEHYILQPQDFFAPFAMPCVANAQEALNKFKTMLAGKDEQLCQTLALNLAVCLCFHNEDGFKNIKHFYTECHRFVRQGEPLKKLESMCEHS